MPRVATYVFLDLETTGIPCEENNKTKITEISLVAVKRQHVMDTRPGATPRVQHKLTLCCNPGRLVNPECTKVTGLCNDLLEHETYFDDKVFTMIDTFLKVLTPPVCLVAQNGLNFDFPILKAHLVRLNVSFPDSLLCADCYHAFYDIMEREKGKSNTNVVLKSESNITLDSDKTGELLPCDETDLILLADTISMQAQNELTPNKKASASNLFEDVDLKSMQYINNKTPKKSSQNLKIVNESHRKEKLRNMTSKARRKFPWSEGEKPKDSYKLKNIYERLFSRPPIETHRAENDCIIALECSIVLSNQFVKWVDDNCCYFSIIKPMTVGVKIGN